MGGGGGGGELFFRVLSGPQHALEDPKMLEYARMIEPPRTLGDIEFDQRKGTRIAHTLCSAARSARSRLPLAGILLLLGWFCRLGGLLRRYLLSKTLDELLCLRQHTYT